MSDNTTLTVRDHSRGQKCKHGFPLAHYWTTPRPGTPPPDFQRYNKGGGDRWADQHSCPGGREVVLQHVLTWDTQDSLTIDWQPGFNGKRVWVEVEHD